ncbi:alpha/beta hydrolase [soil metagenome]
MTAILIHGAWQGSWAWNALLPWFAEAGIAAQAVDLPGNGSDNTPAAKVSLELYVAHLGDAIAQSDGPVQLIAHSGGGVIASQAAERFRDRVAGIVYVAGMMLPDGGSFADVVNGLVDAGEAAAGIRPHLQWSPDRSTTIVPAAAARDIFYHDCTAADAEAACARLTPQPEGGRAISPRLTSQRFGTVPRLYVEALQDRSLILATQRRMQQLVPGSNVVSLDSGHAPQLSMPGRLAGCIIPWLKAPAASLPAQALLPFM